MMKQSEAIALAARLLKLSEKEAEDCCFRLEQAEGYYFSVPTKGGASLIVSDDGEVLYANSSVGFDDHVKAFQDGIRTPLAAFEAE